MSRHKCSADSCPRAVINGPKMKCCKCDALCYLQCYGFESGTKIDGQDTVKITFNNEVVLTTFLSTMAFSCCTSTLAPAEQKASLKMPSVTRSASKSRSKSNENEQLLANELSSIKEMLTSIKNATEANTAEIAEIKSLSSQTDANVKKVSEQNATMNLLSTPMAPAMDYVRSHRARSYAKAAAATTNNKRKRTDSPLRHKQKFPEAKVGTKTNVNGLSVVPKPNRNRDDKPNFAKALYVSGLDPATTNEQLADYIVANTSVNDQSKFLVHKMVEKDADVSQLKFVSSKVEINAEELEILDNVDLWPSGIRVREFQMVPKNQLGSYFPSLPSKAPVPTSANGTTEPMQL